MNSLKIKICSWILKTLLENTPHCKIREAFKHHVKRANKNIKEEEYLKQHWFFKDIEEY